MNSEIPINASFFQLVISLQIATMQYLGKVTSPLSGKIERNLDQAKSSIDLLEMLEQKTKNNLSSEEEKFLSKVLFELRLNYLDEMKKGPGTATPEAKSEMNSGAKEGI